MGKKRVCPLSCFSPTENNAHTEHSRRQRGLHSIFLHGGIFPVHITDYEAYFNPCVPLKVFAVLIESGPSGASKRQTAVNLPGENIWNEVISDLFSGKWTANYSEWEFQSQTNKNDLKSLQLNGSHCNSFLGTF